MFDSVASAQVTTAGELIDAVNNGAEGATISISEGRFELAEPLRPKPGMILLGAGTELTTLVPVLDRDPGTTDLPDGEANPNSINRDAYLIDLGDRVRGVSISGMTLSGSGRLHGAIHGNNSDGLELYDLQIEDFVWSGVRTFRLDDGSIHDISFHNARGKVDGRTGGGLYLTWTRTSEIYNNRFTRGEGSSPVFGIKGYEFSNTRIHHK